MAAHEPPPSESPAPGGDEVAALRAEVARLRIENQLLRERIHIIIKQLFDKKSETLDPTVTSVSVSPDDGRYQVSVTHDGILQVRDLETGKCLNSRNGIMRGIKSVSLCPDGRRAVVTLRDSCAIRVWDMETLGHLCILDSGLHHILELSMNPDGRRVVGLCYYTLVVCDLEGQCLCTLEGHTERVNCVCVSPDGRRAVSGSDDKTLRVWDLETGACMAVYHAGASIDSVAISPSGDHIDMRTFDGQVHSLTPINLPPCGPPIVTAVRLWHFGDKGAPGHRDEHITCRCPHCGQVFDPSACKMLASECTKKVGIAGELLLPPRQQPETDSTPHNLASCPYCNDLLLINPFVVDGSAIGALWAAQHTTEAESHGGSRNHWYICEGTGGGSFDLTCGYCGGRSSFEARFGEVPPRFCPDCGRA